VRRHAVDKNQRPIVRALRKLGAKVVVITGAGEDGAPDLFVGWKGETIGMEVKQPDGKPSEAQKKFHKEWPGARLCYVRSVGDAVREIGVQLAPAEMDALLAHAYQAKKAVKSKSGMEYIQANGFK
jgi:hypothetical protein